MAPLIRIALPPMLALAAIAASFNSYADSLVRADKDDVEMLLNAASGVNSAYWATYIGEAKDRVYVEFVTMVNASSLVSNTPKYVIYWLPRSELTEEQLNRFRAFKTKMKSSQ